MKTPILYSFIRFRPYVETGEFVNVGLIMCQPQQCVLTYRLVAKNDPRISHFFYRSQIFANIREVLNDELKQITQQTFLCSPQEMAQFFHHYTDLKEGTIQYSTVKVAMVDDPMMHFEHLFQNYIKRAGVQTESQEQTIIKTYKAMFKAENIPLLNHYKQHAVQGETAKFNLPLALKDSHTTRILKGIKPLAFDQVETASMIEHCDAWAAKINRATEEGLIAKEDILFALDTPDSASKVNILTAIKRTFDRFNIQYIDWRERKKILSFATNVKTF